MKNTPHNFGGDWTDEKLKCLSSYLTAYGTALKKQDFYRLYIDAFAGNGWITLRKNVAEDNGQGNLFSTEDPTTKPIEGSARIALKIDPKFSEYIFIEKDHTRYSELENLKVDFPDLKDKINLIKDDANLSIQSICNNYQWMSEKKRAVLFLDPYGMQVSWETIRIIAETKAIDLWYLFPLGMALNRLLRRDGNIDVPNRRKIDEVLGTSDWYDYFYGLESTRGLFDNPSSKRIKTANNDIISRYFIDRLKTVFTDEGVAENPRFLYNSKNIPLYLLCFASGNPKGAPIAVRIAEHILGK
jgi:three-Cys-motif partner protein